MGHPYSRQHSRIASFADASSLAYAAAIYCRQKHNGKIKVQLLVSKTKVAPVKQVSIPRLELCVLSWLSGHPRKWKTFVANRTSEIIEVLPTKHWRHVPSKKNPADIASRASQGSSISSSHINTTSLTFSETKTAEETIIRWVQGFYFQEEIRSIKKQISLPPKSPLRSLHPFIDEHGLVRVGGRLQNSQLRFNAKHPIILPSQHSISELLIKEQHIAHLHAGPTLLAHVLRQSHWIVGSRKLINKCIRKCLKCNKFKTSTTTPQLMGNLPKSRVTLERPFFSCGIDYAGPVLIKCNKGRGTKSTKGYIALFVCLATKAVHIEAVGDLTTDSFIAALRRFSARRGGSRHIL
ncbi:integrase catalytic domain-containing protein [Trichonephila clavipes]|uniref:Integrase catalytic domain-containing protein n=1 Tax=Trichonephila clavipes TaxID=2585209 RepID=A0A8X6WFU6_TRICX|nr:integrase catalytic domain-containing protein [Trichonephila clavipes]